MESEPAPRKRQPRADGERTRAAILNEATALATLHGLEGLTIGRLAELTGMSKSGLFAHFGSKESLQLAVVGAAIRTATREYTGPAMAAATPLERLWGLCELFLSFVERRVYPGGCFFSAVIGEMRVLPEPVRERIIKHQHGWLGLLTQLARQAIAAGELHTELTAEQISFELHSLTHMANDLYVAHGDAGALDQAWDGVRRLLGDPRRPRHTLAPPAAASATAD
jgi:AcrR family transcriptional regulator